MTPLLDNPYLEKVCDEIWANAVPAPRSRPSDQARSGLGAPRFDRFRKPENDE